MAAANKGMLNGGSSKPKNKNPFLRSTDQESNLGYCAKLEESSQKSQLLLTSKHTIMLLGSEVGADFLTGRKS